MVKWVAGQFAEDFFWQAAMVCDTQFPPRPLQLSSEGAVLEGNEETVQFRQQCDMRLLQFLNRRDSAGEFVLKRDRRTQYSEVGKQI
jgi:hypothetical protein